MGDNPLMNVRPREPYHGVRFGTQEWCDVRNATMHRDDIEWVCDGKGGAFLRDKPEWTRKHTQEMKRAYDDDRARWKAAQRRAGEPTQ